MEGADSLRIAARGSIVKLSPGVNILETLLMEDPNGS